MLSDLQTYIAKQGVISLKDLSLHFRTDPSVLQPMVDTLIRKGRVRALQPASKCGGCNSCDSKTLILYEWVGTAK